MITALKSSLAAAVLSAFAIFAPMGDLNSAFAEPGREAFTTTFRYNPKVDVQQNYAAFLRQATAVCTDGSGQKPLALEVTDRACVADVMDKLVSGLQRADLAALHADRTGRASPSRSYAGR